MDKLTREQRLQIVEIFYQNNGSVRQTYRALRPFYGSHNRPSEQLIRRTMDRFRTTFSVNDKARPVRRQTVRTEQAIAAVQQSIEEDPHQSIRHRSHQMAMCPSTLWKILRKDLGIMVNPSQAPEELYIQRRGADPIVVYEEEELPLPRVTKVAKRRTAAKAKNKRVDDKDALPSSTRNRGRKARQPKDNLDLIENLNEN